MTPTQRIDLHLHSTASDGTVSPAAVVAAALEAGLTLIALTDHDTAAGVPAARAAAEGTGLTVLAGIEVSATWERGEIHILGYGVDPAHPAIVAHGARAATRRAERMEGMVARLRDQGVNVTMEEVEAVAGVDRESLARPHLARAMVAAGYVEHTWEAFDRYIGDAHPAFVPTNLVSVEDALALIRESGGISSWAHPPEEHMDELLPRMRRAGLDALEVYRPRTPLDRVRRFERRARSGGYLLTGGSDWHGPEGAELGSFQLEAQQVAPFLERVGVDPSRG
jgi:3',5'-nucleoside bisphosphate phosphatase